MSKNTNRGLQLLLACVGERPIDYLNTYETGSEGSIGFFIHRGLCIYEIGTFPKNREVISREEEALG